jgi:hypothetical protein
MQTMDSLVQYPIQAPSNRLDDCGVSIAIRRVRSGLGLQIANGTTPFSAVP